MPRKARPLTPHVLKVNDHVYQRLNPEHEGTVVKVVKDRSFTVVYDYPERKPGQVRVKFTYQWEQMHLFLLGKPPVTVVHREADDAAAS